MKVKLKPLKNQVLVITGASSGIGLETARQAVHAGAQVVLASRNLEALREIAEELNEDGPGRALPVRCDVKNAADCEALAARAIKEFGRIDTWVNNAGVSIFGRLTEVPLEEKRELFETNFWGVVNGCRSAVKSMKDSGGGAIINLGSVVSDRAIPLQGMYAASKHAVKAYTDGLRMELEEDGGPFTVSLIKPAAIDTPYLDHGTNHMKHHPTHVGPVYSPSIAAKAILSAAVTGKRDTYVGSVSPVFALLEAFAPRLGDWVMERTMMERQQSDKALDAGVMRPNLRHAPSQEGFVRGSYPNSVSTFDLFTEAQMHPVATAAIASVLGLAAAAGVTYALSASRPASGHRPGLNH